MTTTTKDIWLLYGLLLEFYSELEPGSLRPIDEENITEH